MTQFYTVDIGNRHPHVGHFQDGKLLGVSAIHQFLEQKGPSPLSSDEWIITSVVGEKQPLENDFFKTNQEKIINFDHWRGRNLFREMPVNYGETLGQDRLYSAYYLFRTETQILRSYTIALIDSGTFTTIDFISSEGFLGGFILPGNQTYLDSYSRGRLLPSLSAEFLDKTPELNSQSLPSSTELAILQSLKLMINSIYNYIDQNLSEGPLCFITTGSGGMAHRNAIKKMDSSSNLILPHRPDLIHNALNYLGQLYLQENSQNTL